MSTLKTAGYITLILSIILKATGFLRESIVAKLFGASAQTDGYIIAFSIITLFVLITSDGFNSVFLPLFIKNRQDDYESSLKNSNGLLNLIIVFMLLFSFLAYFFVPFLVPMIFMHMSPETEVISIRLTKFFVIFLSAITINGMLESYLQAYRSFVPTQISRILATITGAIFALLFNSLWGIDSLAYGFITGIILGIIVQIINLKKLGYNWSLTFSVDPDFRRTFFALSLPAVLSSIVGQVNVTVDRIFATNTITGAVTYLNDASLIVSIPNAILGTTIIAIVFTLLSETVNEREKFQHTVMQGFQMNIILLMPLTAGLAILGIPVVGFVFERGAFSHNDTLHTYYALLVYLPMIITQGLQIVVLKALYAEGKTKLILKMTIVTIICNAIANYIFAKFMGYLGPALSSAIIAVIFLILTTKQLYKGFEKGEFRKVIHVFMKTFTPTIIMAIAVYLVYKFTIVFISTYLVALIIYGAFGVIVFLVMLKFFYKEGYERTLGYLPLGRMRKLLGR